MTCLLSSQNLKILNIGTSFQYKINVFCSFNTACYFSTFPFYTVFICKWVTMHDNPPLCYKNDMFTKFSFGSWYFISQVQLNRQCKCGHCFQSKPELLKSVIFSSVVRRKMSSYCRIFGVVCASSSTSILTIVFYLQFDSLFTILIEAFF